MVNSVNIIAVENEYAEFLQDSETLECKKVNVTITGPDENRYV